MKLCTILLLPKSYIPFSHDWPAASPAGAGVAGQCSSPFTFPPLFIFPLDCFYWADNQASWKSWIVFLSADISHRPSLPWTKVNPKKSLAHSSSHPIWFTQLPLSSPILTHNFWDLLHLTPLCKITFFATLLSLNLFLNLLAVRFTVKKKRYITYLHLRMERSPQQAKCGRLDFVLIFIFECQIRKYSLQVIANKLEYIFW